jgi:hypothetical protein
VVNIDRKTDRATFTLIEQCALTIEINVLRAAAMGLA